MFQLRGHVVKLKFNTDPANPGSSLKADREEHVLKSCGWRRQAWSDENLVISKVQAQGRKGFPDTKSRANRKQMREDWAS